VRFDGDPRDPEAARRALAGAEVVLYLAYIPAEPDDDNDGGAPAAREARDWRSDREILDRATRGTYVLMNAAVEAGVRRVVLASTLALFDRYPSQWSVTEAWRPLPDVTDVRQLAAYLAEESAKQIAYVEPIQVNCLRLPVDSTGRPDDETVQALVKALDEALTRRAEHGSSRLNYGWWVTHVGHRSTPDRSVTTTPAAAPDRSIRSVVVFGAGGPLASAAAPLLAPSYQLRLTDLRPIAEIVAEGKPQSPGAPLPVVPPAPHETRVVDVADLDQVLAACAGMDAIVNCTVVRPHPVNAFLVNCIGAYHVMRAAVAHGIRRVVQTGPLQVLNDRQGGYGWDFGVPDDAPPRPGGWLYTHSKYLGQEVVRLFAEQFGLSVPCLLFCNFVNPEVPRNRPGVGPFTISWNDAGHAIRRAVEVPDLPSPFESFHVMADLPHGKYSGAKADRLLGWYPRDSLEHLYTRRG
jgi:nucleoside-diphosphate-sugar epimerase